MELFVKAGPDGTSVGENYSHFIRTRTYQMTIIHMPFLGESCSIKNHIPLKIHRLLGFPLHCDSQFLFVEEIFPVFVLYSNIPREQEDKVLLFSREYSIQCLAIQNLIQ